MFVCCLLFVAESAADAARYAEALGDFDRAGGAWVVALRLYREVGSPGIADDLEREWIDRLEAADTNV